MPDIFVSNANKDFPFKKTESVASKPVSQAKEYLHVKHPDLLTSFCDFPKNVSFAGQDKDEKVLLFLRKHIITNLTWFITAATLFLAPLIFFIIIRMTNFPLITLPSGYLMVFIIYYYLIVFSYIFINFITWYYNIFLVTQKRIVDLDYSNIVYHHSSVTKLELVQDVSHSRSGFLASFFNFGDLFVQTAGNEPNLEAYSAPQPSKAAQIIADLIGNRRRKK